MPNAVTNRAQLVFVEEAAYGGALSATALKRLRITGENIQHDSNRQFSGEIDPNRDRVAMVELSKAANGTFDSEMSFLDFEVLLRALLGAGAGLPNTPIAGTTRYTNAGTLKSYYIEKQFTDINAFIGVYGAAFSSLSLDITANDIVKGTFGIVCQKTTKEAASRGLSVTASSQDAIMRAGFDVANIKLGGSALSAAVQRLTLQINNNVRPTTQVGIANPSAMQFGAFEVTGQMTAYFPDTTLYDDMLANTSRSLEFTISNPAGAFRFYMPAIKLTGGAPLVAGQNADVMTDIPIAAQKGAGAEAYTMALDVTPV